MNAVLLEIVFIGFLLLLNAIFSASEMAVVSSKKTRLMQWADEGRAGAERALKLANDPGQFLSTVQIGITLVGILAGVFSGARAAEALQAAIAANLPFLADYASVISVGIMVSAVTFLSIVVGELVPKRIALHSPEAFASFIAVPMESISKVASPLVYVLDRSSSALLRLVGRHAPSLEPPVTGEEIKTLVDQGAQAGIFEPAEREMMNRVLAFSDESVHAMMTPRPQIIWLDIDVDFEVNRFKITTAPHSHFPAVRGNLDTVLGTVHVKDIYSYDVQQSADLASILTPPLFIPESSGTLHVIEMFRRTGVHVAFIIDEYGGVQGLVTLTDLLEALVGDLPSATPEDDRIVRREDSSWLVDGTLPIGDFKRHFDLEELPGEEKAGFQTVAGYILSSLGRIPRTGDFHRWNGMRFEVVDMDGNRIDKILVQHPEKLPEPARADA